MSSEDEESVEYLRCMGCGSPGWAGTPCGCSSDPGYLHVDPMDNSIDWAPMRKAPKKKTTRKKKKKKQPSAIKIDASVRKMGGPALRARVQGVLTKMGLLRSREAPTQMPVEGTTVFLWNGKEDTSAGQVGVVTHTTPCWVDTTVLRDDGTQYVQRKAGNSVLCLEAGLEIVKDSEQRLWVRREVVPDRSRSGRR